MCAACSRPHDAKEYLVCCRTLRCHAHLGVPVMPQHPCPAPGSRSAPLFLFFLILFVLLFFLSTLGSLTGSSIKALSRDLALL